MGFFIFGDIDTRNFNARVFDLNTDSSAAKSIDEVIIPGRNGTLTLANHRYENVSHRYMIVINDNAEESLIKLRDAMHRYNGYQKLVDDIHEGEFYMAKYRGGLEPKIATGRALIKFIIEFDRLPQRFLDEGESTQTIGEWGETETQTGDIVTVDNPDGDIGFKEVTANLAPIQSLNGYDKPWVGGAGKNKAEPIACIGRGTNLYREYSGDTITAVTDGFTATLEAGSRGLSIYLGYYTSGQTVTFSATTNRNMYRIGYSDSIPTGTTAVSQTIVTTPNDKAGTWTFSCPADGHYWANYYESGQTSLTVTKTMAMVGTTVDAYEPWENICPISGHTSVTANRTGKNLFDAPTSGGRTNSGITWVYNADGTLTATGTATGNSWSYISSLSESVLPAGTYTVSVSSPFGLVVRKDSVYIYNGSNSTYTFTLEESATIETYARVATGTTVNDAVTGIMLTKGSTATDYEPYQGDTYTVSLSSAGTVYGGTLDVVSGKLTVDRARIDLGTLTWNYASPRFYANAPVDSVGITAEGDTQLLCDSYDTFEVDSLANMPDGSIFLNSSRMSSSVKRFVIRNSNYTDASALKTSLDGVYAVYTLATPITYDLTTQDITALIGENNLWNSEGTTTVVFGEDANGAFNPTEQESQPLIRVYGYGTLQVGDMTITIANYNKSYIDIDCEMMDCFNGATNLNQYVTFSGLDFPVFESGLNRIKYSGNISKVEVKGRWWRV